MCKLIKIRMCKLLFIFSAIKLYTCINIYKICCCFDLHLCLVVVNGIPNFGVSTATLNTTNNSRKWCKLNFGPLRDQVKSRHFLERRDTRRQYFYFLYKILE